MKKEKEIYLERKQILLEKERKNYNKLYLIKTFDGWYKLFGHSALILSRYLQDKAGKKYILHPDQDYGVRDSIGSISIPKDKLAEFKLRMKGSKVNLVREWETGLEYEIGEKLTEEDMIEMQRENELLAEKANQLVLPHAIMPELRADVREMARIAHECTNHQPKISKMGFLADMEREATEINMMMIRMSRGAIEIDKCLNSLLTRLETMYEYATTLADYDMVTPKKYFAFVKKIRAVEDQAKREIKKQTLKEIEKTLKKGAESGSKDNKRKRA